MRGTVSVRVESESAYCEVRTDFHLDLGISRSLHNEIVQVLGLSKSLQASLFVKGGVARSRP